MGFLKLCSGDPLNELLKETFQATPIKVPEEKYSPLGVIASFDDSNKYLGTITSFLTDTSPFPHQIMSTPMADVSGQKTKEVNFDLGFDLLQGFLNGFGVNGASLKSNLKGVKRFSFSFKDVKRNWLDLGVLGTFLKKKTLDLENPASGFFKKANARCLVIDSTIVSSNFTINVEDAEEKSFKIDIEAVKKTIGELSQNLGVKSSTGLDISFIGNKSLAFAFSTVLFYINKAGHITMVPEKFEAQSADIDSSSKQIVRTPDRFLFNSIEDVAIEFDS